MPWYVNMHHGMALHGIHIYICIYTYIYIYMYISVDPSACGNSNLSWTRSKAIRKRSVE